MQTKLFDNISINYDVFIVEGPDNSGKDFICNQILAACLRNKETEYSPLLMEPKFIKDGGFSWQDYMMQFKHTVIDLTDKFPVIILNRSWYGEYVYGQLYRNDTYYKDDSWMFNNVMYDFEYNGVNVIYINITADTDVLISREDGKSFSEGKKEKIELEKELFQKLYNRIDYKKITIDTSTNEPKLIDGSL